MTRNDDSVVVTTTVRVLSPFVLTFALFTLFHGTSSVGGGFQGGVVAAAVVVMLAFAFGVPATAAWLRSGPVVALLVAGPVAFGAVALAGIASGGAYLQFDRLPIPKPSVYATEIVEIGIGATVAGVVAVVFLALAGRPGEEAGEGAWIREGIGAGVSEGTRAGDGERAENGAETGAEEGEGTGAEGDEIP